MVYDDSLRRGLRIFPRMPRRMPRRMSSRSQESVGVYLGLRKMKVVYYLLGKEYGPT